MTEASTTEDPGLVQAERLVRLLGIVFSFTTVGFAAEDELELTLHEARALAALSRLGKTRMGQFACTLGLHVSTATRTVDRLIKKGLVTRSNPDEDRRCVVVALSDRGAARERCLLRHRTARANEMLLNLAADEREQLLSALGRLMPSPSCLDGVPLPPEIAHPIDPPATALPASGRTPSDKAAR